MSNEFELHPVETSEEWNRLMLQCRHTDLQQTWGYGRAVNSCIGWKPEHAVLTSRGEPVAMAQTLMKELPILGWVARMQHGPMFVVDGGTFDSGRAVEALAFLRRHWVDEKGMILHLTPCLFPGDLPGGWEEKAGFSVSDEVLWQSVRFDLDIDEETLFSAMRRDWRRSTRIAVRNDLEVESDDSDELFAAFLEKYREITDEKGITWPSVDLVRELRAETGTDTKIMFALKDGERISAMCSIAFADTSYSFVVWNGPKSGTLHSHLFLIWQSVLYYRKQGYRWYDLSGIDPVNLPGITNFKRGCGGEEYSLTGNYEAKPEGIRDKISGTDYRRGLGHVFSGLELPEEGTKKEADVITAKVAAILDTFIRETTGIEVALDKDVSLVDGGLIDSLSIISLVMVLQEAFGIELSAPDLTIDNFDKLDALVRLIREKMDYDGARAPLRVSAPFRQHEITANERECS